MLTVLEAISKSTEFLEKRKIESPRANAEQLLAHVLKCKRLELYLAFDRPLKQDETDTGFTVNGKIIKEPTILMN